MNGMNFKPFISRLLDSLSDEQLGEFARLIDLHSSVFKNRSLVTGTLTTSDKGIGLYTIELDRETIKTGYLVYNDSFCVLLAYQSNSEKVTEYVIANNNYTVVKEFLTTDYLRHEVAIRATQVGEAGSVVAKLEVSDIKAMTKEQLDQLEAGDIVNKRTGNELHSYRVSYKGTGAGTGICLTYSDAGYIETVSYDRSGNNWVYNSTDVSAIGGTQLYRHSISAPEYMFNVSWINNSPVPKNTSNAFAIDYTGATALDIPLKFDVYSLIGYNVEREQAYKRIELGPGITASEDIITEL